VAPLLRFVDSIQNAPTVRLDLNDWVTWGTLAETDFGMPAMRRTVTSSMLRDGEHVGASAYGNRELTLVLKLIPASANTAAAQLQLLHRELDRPTNLLQYIPEGAANAVFFRTFRSSPDAVQFDPILKQVHVTLLAEPFALGVREDLAAITVRNDPTLVNGLFCDLTGIKGDVEVPLFIEYADGGGGLARSGFTVGVRSGSAPYPNRFIQAESMSAVTDTSVVADAAFSGGSKARTTFVGIQALAARLGGKFPNLTDPAGAENWGVYRVFARVAQTVATDVISLAIGAGAGTNSPSVTIKSQTQPQMVDLGTVDATAGLATAGGYAATEYRIEYQAALRFYAARTSGSGSLDIDYLVFVPADECLGSWSAFPDALAATDLGVLDGPNDSAYLATALSGATPGRYGAWPAAITGRLPRVMPGNNRLVIVESSKDVPPTTNLLTSSINMTIRYWPRYLLVRPVGT
jgi:hypothetical protein